MKNDKKGNIFNPIIFSPGLNQFYFVDFNFLNYQDLSKEVKSTFKNKISTINIDEIIKKLDEDFKNNKIKSYFDYKNLLLSKLNINWSHILEIFQELIDKITFLHKNQISFLKTIKGNIYNENPFHLFIDEICLTKFQNENNIKLEYFTLKELFSSDICKNLILNNNKLFIYSYKPSILLSFKKEFQKNIFTFLLNTYLFCFKDKNTENEEYKITK